MIAASLFNPIRFQKMDTFDFLKNSEDCYLQKWQFGDVVTVQFMADEAVTLTIHDAHTNQQISSHAGVIMPTNLVDTEFQIYELNVELTEIPYEGFFYFKLSTIEGASDMSPFHYKMEWPETILLYYRNTENDFDIIFETGIEFYIRVEGALYNYSPGVESEVYFDQKHNPVQLFALPYRIFTLQIGRKMGVAEWMADLINNAMACDVKRVNGFGIERNEGATWDIFRVEGYSLIGLAIEVVQQVLTQSGSIKQMYVLGDSNGNAIYNRGLISHN